MEESGIMSGAWGISGAQGLGLQNYPYNVAMVDMAWCNSVKTLQDSTTAKYELKHKLWCLIYQSMSIIDPSIVKAESK